MRVLPFLDGDAAIVRGVEQLAREPLLHRIFRTPARRRNQPADCQGLAAVGADLDRHLIGGAADPARANLDGGPYTGQRLVEDPDRILAAALLNAVEGAVDNALGDRLLALVHQAIHEFGHNLVAEFRIRQNLAFDRGATTRHRSSSRSLFRPLGAVFGTALAPILDALGVMGAADDVIAHAGQVLDAAAADQHDRVLLQIVALAGNVAGDLETIGQADAGDLAQRRVRLLRRRRIDARADPALLRTLLHRRDLVARQLRLPRLVDQLVYRRHRDRPLVKPKRTFAKTQTTPTARR